MHRLPSDSSLLEHRNMRPIEPSEPQCPFRPDVEERNERVLICQFLAFLADELGHFAQEHLQSTEVQRFVHEDASTQEVALSILTRFANVVPEGHQCLNGDCFVPLL